MDDFWMQSGKALKFSWCGWLVSGTHASLPFFLMAISGMFCWDRKGDIGQARDPESSAYVTVLLGIPS